MPKTKTGILCELKSVGSWAEFVSQRFQVKKDDTEREVTFGLRAMVKAPLSHRCQCHVSISPPSFLELPLHLPSMNYSKTSVS